MEFHLIDLHQRRTYPARITVENGRITSIEELDYLPANRGYILPGFIDAHVHIESSMLPPAEFGRMAVVHGTVATVSDPHEIANVLGVEGVEYMLKEAEKTPLKICFGAPSCVPATTFETAGATLTVEDVKKLLDDPRIGYLSEMMNFPGVLSGFPEVMDKIAAAHKVGKPVDGHAPGLVGSDARKYFEAGISTDHECFMYGEGYQKATLGVKILIREGSAARNFEALWPLLNEFPDQIMFCSDDKHPDDLVKGHINLLVKRALDNGCDLYDTLRAACVNPAAHYLLPVGLLREGDAADFIEIDNPQDFTIRTVWINGEKVAVDGRTRLSHQRASTPNQFRTIPRTEDDFSIAAPFLSDRLMPDAVFPSLATPPSFKVRVIEARDGQIVTGSLKETVLSDGFFLQPDPGRDILFIAVVNRYQPNDPPSVAFVRGFRLREGALASSVAHDSHNIVAVGTNAEALCRVVNEVIACQGGIAATSGSGETRSIPLPIAGLMSDKDGYELANTYQELDAWVKDELGCVLAAPFMVMSFLALPVIPSLKITDLGLFDVDSFDFTEVIV